jgi:CelD/BcsL family acetyltransferase involved in cellulose biosynthesis
MGHGPVSLLGRFYRSAFLRAIPPGDTAVCAEAMQLTVSNSFDEPEWDRFLQATPLGEFQQTTGWAKFKQASGWNCARTVLTENQRVVGGFQLLWRRTRLGAIGYVSKGPVSENEDRHAVDALVEHLVLAARALRLRAMIVQPPSLSRQTVPRLKAHMFAPDRLTDIYTASIQVDVSGEKNAIFAGMSRTKRQMVRQAIRRDVLVREGNEQDLDGFFQLMLKTSQRQGVAPSPPNKESLHRFWKAFGGGERCHLFLAERNGRTIGGLFCFHFRDTLYGWRKGATPEDLKHHPIELLYYESFLWAHNKGFRCVDFCSLDRNMAETLINGLPLSEAQKTSRDFFHLGFGGRPVIMPDAHLYFANPLLRGVYQASIKNQLVVDWLRKMTRRFDA